ncbi:MAG: glutamate formimidoyltransferase [Actinomycetota bacterium]
MTLIAVPNVSEGSDLRIIHTLSAIIKGRGARLLDIHADGDHGRSVFTVAGEPPELVAAMTALALGAATIDLTEHKGVHPRLGSLDVLPFVPHDTTMQAAIEAAHTTGAAIGERGTPVYYYGLASTRDETRELPDIRRGGLGRLITRAASGLSPDEGPAEIDPRRGVVCIGARDVLIAFNVFVDCDLESARTVAAGVRGELGPRGVRALGLDLPGAGRCQVAMNLTEPIRAGIEDAFEMVRRFTEEVGGRVTGTELVGLVPERFRPNRNAEAARLLIEPGRSLEAALQS